MNGGGGVSQLEYINKGSTHLLKKPENASKKKKVIYKSYLLEIIVSFFWIKRGKTNHCVFSRGSFNVGILQGVKIGNN